MLKLLRHKRVWMGCAAVLLVLVGIVGLLVYFSEPRHQGRSLSFWLEEYHQGNSKAREAVLAIGPEATPALLRMLASGRKPFLRRRLERLLGMEEDYTGLADEWQKGQSGFFILGEKAAPAIPLIVPLLTDKDRAPYAWDILTLIGRPALPTARQFLTSTNRETQRSAVFAMAGVLNQDEPALQELLAHEDPIIRGETFIALAVYAQRTGSGYFERIVAGLEDPDPFAASHAAIALRLMGDTGTNALPELYRLEGATNALVAAEIASSIKTLTKRMRIQQSSPPRPRINR
jgi:HEAT repeat protein